jgi:hypothetical protein
MREERERRDSGWLTPSDLGSSLFLSVDKVMEMYRPDEVEYPRPGDRWVMLEGLLPPLMVDRITKAARQLQLEKAIPIRRALDSGLSHSEIATELDIHEEWIEAYLRRTWALRAGRSVGEDGLDPEEVLAGIAQLDFEWMSCKGINTAVCLVEEP